MARRPTLSDMLAPKPGEAAEPAPPDPELAQSAAPLVVKRKRGRPPNPPVLRDDAVRGQTLRLKPAAWRQLKILAIDQDKTAHDMLLEALNDLFVKYGKAPIA